MANIFRGLAAAGAAYVEAKERQRQRDEVMKQQAFQNYLAREGLEMQRGAASEGQRQFDAALDRLKAIDAFNRGAPARENEEWERRLKIAQGLKTEERNEEAVWEAILATGRSAIPGEAEPKFKSVEGAPRVMPQQRPLFQATPNTPDAAFGRWLPSGEPAPLQPGIASALAAKVVGKRQETPPILTATNREPRPDVAYEEVVKQPGGRARLAVERARALRKAPAGTRTEVAQGQIGTIYSMPGVQEQATAADIAQGTATKKLVQPYAVDSARIETELADLNLYIQRATSDETITAAGAKLRDLEARILDVMANTSLTIERKDQMWRDYVLASRQLDENVKARKALQEIQQGQLDVSRGQLGVARGYLGVSQAGQTLDEKIANTKLTPSATTAAGTTPTAPAALTATQVFSQADTWLKRVKGLLQDDRNAATLGGQRISSPQWRAELQNLAVLQQFGMPAQLAETYKEMIMGPLGDAVTREYDEAEARKRGAK